MCVCVSWRVRGNEEWKEERGREGGREGGRERERKRERERERERERPEGGERATGAEDTAHLHPT